MFAQDYRGSDGPQAKPVSVREDVKSTSSDSTLVGRPESV